MVDDRRRGFARVMDALEDPRETMQSILRSDLRLPALSIVLGALLWSISINGILVHHKFISGGISGLSLVIHYLFPPLSVGLLVFLINIPLFMIGWTMLAGKFFFFSLLGMSSLALFLTLTTHLRITVENPLLAAIFAGVISGCGSGLIFRAGGSGGGTGIIAMVLNRRLSVRVGVISSLLNSIPLVLGAFFVNLDAALFSVIYIFVAGSVMDRIMAGFNERRSVFIISTHSRTISEEIMTRLHRGATLLSGRGAYTKAPREIIYCVVSLFELAKLKDLVKEIDPDAFLIINETREVIGRGFDFPPD